MLKKQLEGLPQWALVALAARCAERVLVLYDGPEERRRDVAHAISVAATAAADASDATAEDARCAAKDAKSAAEAVTTFDAADAAASAAFAAAFGAAFSEFRASTCIAAVTFAKDAALHHAVNAMKDATDAMFRKAAPRDAGATPDATAAQRYAVDSMKADLDTLLQTAASEAWDDDTPVPQSVFGPLWRNGPPEGWPQEQE